MSVTNDLVVLSLHSSRMIYFAFLFSVLGKRDVT